MPTNGDHVTLSGSDSSPFSGASDRARQLFIDTLEHIAELARRWRDNGYLPPDADTKAVAATLLSIMQGLIVMHQVVDDVSAHALRTGVALLGAATRTPPPTSTPAKQTTP